MLASWSATASAKGFSPQSDPNRSVIHASWTFVAGLPDRLLSSFQTGFQFRPPSVVFATPIHLLPFSSRSRYDTYAVSGLLKLVAIARTFSPLLPRRTFRQVAPSSSDTNPESSPTT